MKKIIILIFALIVSFIIPVNIYAQEKITLSTYYPAPYGEYRTLSIGDTYTAPNPAGATNLDLVVEGRVGIGTQTQGDIRSLLDIYGAGDPLIPGHSWSALRTSMRMIGGNATNQMYGISLLSDNWFSYPYSTGLNLYYNACDRTALGTKEGGISFFSRDSGDWDIFETAKISFHKEAETDVLNRRGSIRFYTANTVQDVPSERIAYERMRIAANGNVGIGTTTPGSKLEISAGGQNNVKLLSFYEDENAFKRFYVRSQFMTVGVGWPNRIIFGSETETNGVTTDRDILTLDAATSNVGIGTTDPQAILDVNSTTSAFLPPRMTATERDAINPAIEGMTIYNNETDKLEVFNGSNWRPAGSYIDFSVAGGSFTLYVSGPDDAPGSWYEITVTNDTNVRAAILNISKSAKDIEVEFKLYSTATSIGYALGRADDGNMKQMGDFIIIPLANGKFNMRKVRGDDGTLTFYKIAYIY